MPAHFHFGSVLNELFKQVGHSTTWFKQHYSDTKRKFNFEYRWKNVKLGNFGGGQQRGPDSGIGSQKKAEAKRREFQLQINVGKCKISFDEGAMS